jgi:hypothetical protein
MEVEVVSPNRIRMIMRANTIRIPQPIQERTKIIGEMIGRSDQRNMTMRRTEGTEEDSIEVQEETTDQTPMTQEDPAHLTRDTRREDVERKIEKEKGHIMEDLPTRKKKEVDKKEVDPKEVDTDPDQKADE